MSSGNTPTGAVGEFVTVPTGPGRVRIIRADAKVWISVQLIRAVQEGHGAACVVLDGDLFTVDGDNLLVSYRLGSTIRAGVNGGDNSRLAYRVELRDKTAGSPFLVAPDPGEERVDGRIAEPGRLVTHRRLKARWPCRWCGEELEQGGRGAIVCLQCDTARMTTV